MGGIRWGKFSGKNGGGACNGGEGRKRGKSEGKDAAKGKGGEGIKARGRLRGRCANTAVANGALTEINRHPHLNSKSLQAEGMVKKIEITGRHNPYSNTLTEVGVIEKSATGEKGFNTSMDRLESKSSSPNNKRVAFLKKFESSEKGVDEVCKEKLADVSTRCNGEWGVKQRIWDNQHTENVKQGICDNDLMEDVKKNKSYTVRGEDATWILPDYKYLKQGLLDMEQDIPNCTHMLHVGLNVNSAKKEKKVHTCDAGGDIDSTSFGGLDKPGNADCMNVVVNDTPGGADCIISPPSNDSIGLDSKGMKDVQRNVHTPEVGRKKDNSYVSAFSELVVVPQDFLCGISKKVMEDPVVIASGLTFERACIQAWLDEGNTLCPVTHEPLSHLELIPNLTLKALISAWYSQSHDLDVESAHHSFCSCKSSFSSCPSLMTPLHQSFVSCSSFSVSKILEDAELYSSFSSSSFSAPKIRGDAELHSSSSSSVSVPSYDTPEHIRAAGIHNFPSSSTISPLSSWDQEREALSLQENALQSAETKHKRRGEDKTVMYKTMHRGNSHSKSSDSMVQSPKPCTYIVSRINDLVSDLQSDYPDIRRSAAAELRLLAKDEDSNRSMIVRAGALRPLVALLWSRDESIQLEATTTLLNLSLNHSLKDSIVKEGAIEALISVLRDGFNTAAMENAAVTLACLAINDENRSKIGTASAVEPLMKLLGRGSPRGRKDAAAALYRLSSNDDENKRRIVRAGASRLLVEFLSKEGDKDGMVDKAFAILCNLVSIEEGRVAFVEEGGISSLMQALQTASDRGKKLAVSILFQLCAHSRKHRSLVLQKDPLPTLMAISQTGNARLKAQIAEVIEILIVDAY